MVIYEDNHLLVVHKYAGELVQGDQTKDRTILDKYKAYIKKKYAKPGEVYLHPVHRLDRPVSGCLILARTSKALQRMNEAFRNGKVQKTYYAISSERPLESEGLLEHYIVKDKSKNISRVVNAKNKQGRKVELRYQLIASTRAMNLLKINPLTGRSHQIRVQMAALGCPVLGDVKYKGAITTESRSIYLHCSAMSFEHPTKKEVMTVSVLPQEGNLWKEFTSFFKS